MNAQRSVAGRKTFSVSWASLVGVVGVLLTTTTASAQSDPTYVQFSPRTVKAALYRPDSGPAPTVAILIAHRTANFLGYSGCGELAARGFLALCLNPRSDNNEAAVLWEKNALDIRSGVEFLRAQPGVEAVLLWGFSGGGPTMSFYQAVAENGVGYCQGEGKLSECGDELAGLPPADGLILVDAHPGNAANSVRRLNGAVINDDEILAHNAAPKIDPTLDPFDPRNGYNPDGLSEYPASFRERYLVAQAARMNRLIDIAQQRLAAIEEGRGPYPDDDVFTLVRGDRATLALMDTRIGASTLKPQKLLRNDGTVSVQIVDSVRLPNPGLREENASFDRGTWVLTLRSFLSARAIRATHSIDGVDHCSSNNSVPCALPKISVPLLITAMSAYNYVRFSEIHLEIAASEDKDFVVIEGARHDHRPCVECETTPGQYSNTWVNFFDYVEAWIRQRFGASAGAAAD